MTPAEHILTTVATDIGDDEREFTFLDLRIHVVSTAHRLYDSAPTSTINAHAEAALALAPAVAPDTSAETYLVALNGVLR